MKNVIVTFFTIISLSNVSSAQTSMDDKLDFARDFVSCHQIIYDALNYNTQPVALQAFFKEANHHLQSAEDLFNKNKDAWKEKIAPSKIEDVEFLFQQYKQFISKSNGLTEQELRSGTFWLSIAKTKNIEITQRILCK